MSFNTTDEIQPEKKTFLILARKSKTRRIPEHSKLYRSEDCLMGSTFIFNLTFRNDLHMSTIEEESRIFYTRFHNRLQTHSNPPIKIFLSSHSREILTVDHKGCGAAITRKTSMSNVSVKWKKKKNSNKSLKLVAAQITPFIKFER